MDPFYDRLILRAATIDEILSEDFETLPGQKRDADLAARRLAAWCSACASGDWLLFSLRLQRDGLTLPQTLARFATVRRRASASTPAWIEDAIWIEAALQGAGTEPAATTRRFEAGTERLPFDDLFALVAEQAEARLWTSVTAPISENLSSSARACLRQLLVKALCDLCAAALYERFARARRANAAAAGSEDGPASSIYHQFAADMREGGFRRLFEDRPVLLRLIASITRQWLTTSREFAIRLHADLAAIRDDLLPEGSAGRVARIEGGLSDPHHGGYSVLIVEFENGARVVYKPKDLRVDAAWHALVERLNRAGAPVELRAMRAIVRDDYGWSEYVEHAGTADAEGCRRFFSRAGAWLALFHGFAGSDIHQENMIAAGDHPVPIDLETILQAAAEENTDEPEVQATEAAKETIASSVLAVGLLPAYGRSGGNEIYVVGGVASDWTAGTKLQWNDINSDTMRPASVKDPGKPTANVPHVDGCYARLGDHISDFRAGFEDYANFLLSQTRGGNGHGLFDDFAGLPVRKVLRPTQFYYMLLQRLKDDRTMADGVLWSAQADFVARLADWEKDSDPAWPLRNGERAALLELNVPRFVLPSDGNELGDSAGISVRIETTPGLERARARLRSLDEQEIAWQLDVIRQNTSSISPSVTVLPAAEGPTPLRCMETAAAPARDTFLAEADRVADEVARHAIRRGSSAAWIGLGWLGESEVSQLTVLGPDLYNGACGIALFFAAHAAARRRAPSAELALAAVAHLRRSLRSRAAARFARSLGIGGATGLGSIVYALAVMAKLLGDDGLLADAHRAAELVSDDLIAADRQLDVIGGSAGAILGLLRLCRDTQADGVLGRALKCGEHLLAQPRVGPEGCRSWRGPAPPPVALNGMSHGAAGFAYALGSLAAATGRADFAAGASECIAFENSGYDAEHSNWPDFREAHPHWQCRWCHGAVGIGLARVAMTRGGAPDAALLEADIRNALAAAVRGWPGHYDSLCCGALGSVEFLSEAGTALARPDLSKLASRRMAAVLDSAAATGDYRWNGAERRFNLGLFRGLAGVGYTCLRQVAGSLPNVLIWE
jgi:type 2 lantibiotic biosynthesis protein LanM